MNKTIKVNDKQYTALTYFNESPNIVFTIRASFDEVYNTFIDGVKWSVIGYKNEEFDMSEYELVGDITYHKNGICTVTMSKLSGTEKLIILHYGGIN